MLGKYRGRILLLAGLGWLALLVAIIPGAGGAQAGVPAGIPAKGAAAQPIGYAGGVPVFQGRLTPVDSRERPPTVTDISSQVKTVDLGKLGIHPSAVPYPIGGAGAPRVSNPFSMISPNGGAIGTQNAYLSLSPDVVSSTTSAAIALIGSGYTPSEVVTVYFNGLFATNATAGAANGRIALLINTGSGQGYLTVEGVGVSSGKRAGSVAQVLDAAAPVPGFGAGPHAVNEVSAGNFGALGIRFQGSSTVSFARNGGTPTNFTSNAAGYVFLNVGLANNGDTAASYTFYTSTTGSMSGVSIEERADAGTPPSGDNNLARAYMDRNILSSSGGTISLVGEGFQPGETVSLGGCTSGSFPADSNGSVGVFLTYGAGTGISTCVFTGTTSSRVGRATAQLATLAINVPSAINQPSNIQSGLVPTYTLLFDRLQASQGGTVYMDGVSQGSASTNASGYGAAVITAPTAIGIHEVAFIGDSGQIAIAPMYVITPTGPTATPTNTPLVSNTPTRTLTPTPCVEYTTSTLTGQVGISATNALTFADPDDGNAVVSLPFPVSFYGSPYSSVRVGANGNVQFVGAGTYYGPEGADCPLPVMGAFGSALTTAFEPYQGDLNVGLNPGNDGVFTSTVGVSPNRQFIIEWRAAYFGQPTQKVNFEVLLSENSSTLSVIYGSTFDNGATVKSGTLENGSGGRYTQFSCLSGVLVNGLRVNYVPQACATPTNTPLVSNTPTITRTPTTTPTIVSGCTPIAGSITNTDATQIGRMTRDGVPSTCAAPKSYPGAFDAAVRHYDSYRFTNNFGTTQCVTVNITSACAEGNNTFSAAYLTAYDPNNIGTNYLADAGSSFVGLGSYSFNVGPGAVFVVVVHEINANVGCSSYTLDVQGNNTTCPTSTPTITTTPVPPTITRTPTATPTCPPVLRVVGPGNPGKVGVAHVDGNNPSKLGLASGASRTRSGAAGRKPGNFDSAPMDFIIDDYVFEDAVGFVSQTSPFTESATIWLNRFTPPGGAYPITLNNIYVAWPDINGSGSQLIGKTVRLLVYNDVDGDGNPDNATQIGGPITATIAFTSPSTPALANFQAYPVNVNVPGPTGDIYIGFEDYFAEPAGYAPGQYPAAIDDSPPSQVRSWAFNNGNVPNISNLSANATRGTIEALSAGAISGNWMIRANGTSSLADPCPPTSTPTATFTAVPTATNTPAVTPALAVHMIWQGIGQPSASNTTMTVGITLRSTGGGTTYSFSGNTDANGVITVGVGSLPNDTYNIRSKGPRNLATCSTVVLTGGLVTNKDMGTQPAGDSNDSNNTNTTDFTILKNSFGKSVGQAGYDARADFNNNDVVNTTDFTLLKGTFGQAGCGVLLSP